MATNRVAAWALFVLLAAALAPTLHQSIMLIAAATLLVAAFAIHDARTNV